MSDIADSKKPDRAPDAKNELIAAAVFAAGVLSGCADRYDAEGMPKSAKFARGASVILMSAVERNLSPKP